MSDKPRINLFPPYFVVRGDVRVRVSPKQRAIIMILMGRKSATFEEVAGAVWGDEWDWPLTWKNNIKVQAHYIRQRLEPFGIEVSHVGRGNRSRLSLEGISCFKKDKY